MNIKITTYGLEQKIPKNVIFPTQVHSTKIVEIKTGQENLKNCDGIFTSILYHYALGIQTADCAPICFYDDRRYGIIHAGWRGLVGGIIEKMLEKFENPHIFVGPLFKEFEIQRDDCYAKIDNKFGQQFFKIHNSLSQEKIIFQFQKAIKSVLPNNTIFDSRDTYQDKSLASWRRDRDKHKTNYMIISND